MNKDPIACKVKGARGIFNEETECCAFSTSAGDLIPLKFTKTRIN